MGDKGGKGDSKDSLVFFSPLCCRSRSLLSIVYEITYQCKLSNCIYLITCSTCGDNGGPHTATPVKPVVYCFIIIECTYLNESVNNYIKEIDNTKKATILQVCHFQPVAIVANLF